MTSIQDAFTDLANVAAVHYIIDGWAPLRRFPSLAMWLSECILLGIVLIFLIKKAPKPNRIVKFENGQS